MNTRKTILVLLVLALVLMALPSASVSACTTCGVGTPGYWKNHPEEWADFVEWKYFGLDPSKTWTQEMVIEMLEMPTKGDKTYTLFRAVVAAKLNYHVGNTGDCWCVGEPYYYARMWLLEDHPVGSGVKASSKAWKQAEPWYLELDAYNNGLLCAPARD